MAAAETSSPCIIAYKSLYYKLTFKFTFTGSKQAFIQFLPDQQPNLL